MALRKKLSNNKKRKIQQLLARAYDALQSAEHGLCERCCNDIDAIINNHADVLYLRALLAAESGQHEQAEDYFTQAIAAAPNRVDVVSALAGLFLSRRQYGQAVARYQQALSLAPHDIKAHIGCAGALICLSRYDEAIALLQAARTQQPGNLDIRMGLFQACHDSGRLVDARKHLMAIIQRAPESAQAHYSLALLELETGNRSAGEAAIRLALQYEPNYTEACSVLADLHRFGSAATGTDAFKQEDTDLQSMQALYERCPAESIERMQMAFSLAKVHDDIARAHQDQPAAFATSLAYMQEANTIRHRFSRYDETTELAHMQAVIDHYSADMFTAQQMDQQPIFILGMPRSGTTLVEQIIAAHPDVNAGGENSLLQNAMASTCPGAACSNTDCSDAGCLDTDSPDATTPAASIDPLAISQWSEEQCRQAGNAYMAALSQRQPGADHYTDKTLSHVIYIGAIARMLPGAKIIHVRRNALDTCFSIYKNNIVGERFDYGHDLGELGRYYRMHEQLMAHWQKVLPTGMWVEVDYEQLVADTASTSKTLITACGLSWDPACLAPQTANRPIQTASMLQVREAVHQRSIGSAEPYRTQLQPLLDALA